LVRRRIEQPLDQADLVLAHRHGGGADALIEQGRFRGDLFYRLNVISITVPRRRLPASNMSYLERLCRCTHDVVAPS
jgi:transcriptional regulator of aromatic amino acid metabolism